MAAVAAPPVAEPTAGAVAGRPAPFHIPSLDGLRAVSFLIVFAAHAGLDRVVPGGFGVTVFFFLSGYLITTLMRLEAEKTGHVSLKHFYLRRALRILPPFYIVLVAATALGAIGFLRGDVRPQLLPVASQVLHVSNYWIAAHGWSGIATGTGVYWSLAVEEHFYLVFPAVFLVLTRLRLTGRQKAWVFWGACALVLAWRCVLVFGLHAGVDRTYLCSDTRVDSIAFGCALAVWNNPMLDGIGGRPPSPLLWRGLLLPAGVALLLVTFVVRGGAFRETLRYTLQGIALTPIFMSAVRWPQWLPFRLLNWRPLRFLGTLSYSLYLVHHATLGAFEQHVAASALTRAVLAFLVSVAVAWTIYRWVEKPCARIRRRLSAAE
jgi:peptidoglycan/LPS O-acetylase OafA/YrhL